VLVVRVEEHEKRGFELSLDVLENALLRARSMSRWLLACQPLIEHERFAGAERERIFSSTPGPPARQSVDRTLGPAAPGWSIIRTGRLTPVVVLKLSSLPSAFSRGIGDAPDNRSMVRETL
jgi:hypothetical protein